MVVYVDVLVALNIFVTYFLLLCTRGLLRKTVKRRRLALGAVLGGLYALIIFVPELSDILSVLLNIAACCLIVLAAIPVHTFREFLKAFGAFLVVNFAFAGLMLALWLSLHPKGMVYNNGAVYFNIDMKVLVLSTLACYGILSLAGFLLKRRTPDNKIYEIELCHNGKTVSAKALLDTGNALSDGFSDTPVLVAVPSVLKALLGTDLDSLFLIKKDFETESSERIRLIPFSTVGDNGVLKAVLIDKVRVPKLGLIVQHVLLAQSKEKNLSDEYSVLLSNNFLERGSYEHNTRKSSKHITKN